MPLKKNSATPFSKTAEIAQKLYDDAMKEAENFCGRMAAQASEKQDAAVNSSRKG
ncbi:MAG: hypothetical protein ACLTK0_02305 [Anaerovoracaceae bacterium]